jgi:hypothetical protein
MQLTERDRAIIRLVHWNRFLRFSHIVALIRGRARQILQRLPVGQPGNQTVSQTRFHPRDLSRNAPHAKHESIGAFRSIEFALRHSDRINVSVKHEGVNFAVQVFRKAGDVFRLLE